MFAILTDKKGFHKVIPIQGSIHHLQTIRFAAMERPIAPETEADLLESVEVNERIFHYERQVSHDTFLYRERP